MIILTNNHIAQMCYYVNYVCNLGKTEGNLAIGCPRKKKRDDKNKQINVENFIEPDTVFPTAEEETCFLSVYSLAFNHF